MVRITQSVLEKHRKKQAEAADRRVRTLVEELEADRNPRPPSLGESILSFFVGSILDLPELVLGAFLD